MITKATLVLNVVYDGEDATEPVCKAQLEDLVRFASNRGLLSGDLDMIVEDFDYTVTTEYVGESEEDDED